MRLPMTTAMLVGVAAGFASRPAPAAEFTIFIHETTQDMALRTDSGPAGRAYWADYAQFGQALVAAGALRGGAPLQPPAGAVVLDMAGRHAGTQRADGLTLGGYFRIEVPDASAAERLAAMAPTMRRGGAVELRESAASPTMTP